MKFSAGCLQWQPAGVPRLRVLCHADRSLFSKLVAALKPGGLLICKLSIGWDTNALLTVAASDPLNRNELLTILQELCVLHHQERPVRDRGVVEFAGKKKIQS
jgi:hypothetical protein